VSEIASHQHLHTLFIEKGKVLSSIPAADQCIYVSIEVLKKITGVQHPEPLAAEVAMPPMSAISSSRYLLILDGLSDPGNLGTLFRSALCLGWEGIFVTENSVDPWNEKAIRAAKGATFIIPWSRGSHEELQTLLKKRILFTADARGTDLSTLSFNAPLALVLGNEAHGVGLELKKLSTLIAIPMGKEIESLNVASAGAILLYQLKRPSQ
jgi:TrmH family RNA methyltransferase